MISLIADLTEALEAMEEANMLYRDDDEYNDLGEASDVLNAIKESRMVNVTESSSAMNE